MALFTRRATPPADVVALLPDEDRVLSWADVDAASGGGVVLASARGLWWPDHDGDRMAGSYRMIGWHLINKATWRDDVLSVVEADVVDGVLLVDRPTVSVRLAIPRDLPPTIRRRVESNVVRSELYALPGGAGRFVARRTPGQDGLTWLVRLEPGTTDSPVARAAIESTVADLQATTGLPDDF
jgi:hypothetical protein